MQSFSQMDAITITAIVSAVLGPGGVFFLLVRKAINGGAEAIHRVERNVSEIKVVQRADHDTLTTVVGKLDAIKGAQDEYHPIVNKHSVQIGQLRERCDLIHKKEGSK